MKQNSVNFVFCYHHFTNKHILLTLKVYFSVSNYRELKTV